MDKKGGKEASFMAIAVSLNREQDKYINGMNEYIKKISASPEAEAEALAALKRTDVVTKQGNLKEKIVSWE